jgi:hypothetical protein
MDVSEALPAPITTARLQGATTKNTAIFNTKFPENLWQRASKSNLIAFLSLDS